MTHLRLGGQQGETPFEEVEGSRWDSECLLDEGAGFGAQLEAENLEKTQCTGTGYLELGDIARRAAPLPLRSRFTASLLLIGAISVCLLLAVVVFISFLWYSDQSNYVWRKIVQTNWFTRSVTLSTLALRFAISLQAGIATSMLAALAIEYSGVPLLKTPELSFSTFSNNGPHTLFWTYLNHLKSVALVVLLGLLTITTFAAQFSSTLLLADVELASVTTSHSNWAIQYGLTVEKGDDVMALSPVGNGRFMQYWNQMMESYPSFGEYSKSEPTEPGIDDTGFVIRSLIPLEERSQREILHDYTGPAATYDARIVCVQPNITFSSTCESGTLCGKVAPMQTVENAVLNLTGVDFTFQLPSAPLCENDDAPDENCLDPPWSLYGLDESAGGLISSLDPTNNSTLRHEWYSVESNEFNMTAGNWVAKNGDQTWDVNFGMPFFLTNATYDTIAGWQDTIALRPTGPWIDYEIVNFRNSNVGYHISHYFRTALCYSALPQYALHQQFQDLNVSLSSSRSRKEPTQRSKVGVDRYDTTDIRIQLGAAESFVPLEQRGILELAGEELMADMSSKRSQWTPPETLYADTLRDGYSGTGPVLDVFNMSTFTWLVDSVDFTTPDYGLTFCLLCLPNEGVSLIQATLFQDIIEKTGSPALALQSHIFNQLRMAYYIWLSSFDAEANVTSSAFTDRLYPVSRHRYFVVMAIVGTHVLVCSGVSILFYQKTKHILLGNAWAAYSQVANSEHARRILDDRTLKSDKEVAKLLKGAGELRRRYRLVSNGDGRGVVLTPILDKAAKS